MRLLLDTNVVIWWLGGGNKVTASLRTRIERSDEVMVSAATGWEIAIKVALGKLELEGDLVQQLTRTDFTPLPITVAHGIAAGRLPPHHRDPFDRVLVAQAQIEGLTIFTSDKKLKAYNVPVILA